VSSPQILGEAQAGVEPLFASAPRPDPLQAARAAKTEAGRLRRRIAETRETYLSAAAELEVAIASGQAAR
jgi:hypothetical protein